MRTPSGTAYCPIDTVKSCFMLKMYASLIWKEKICQLEYYKCEIIIYIAAFICQLVFMVAAGYIMKPVAACVCLTLAVGLGGFAWAGFSVNHLDIAPQVD